MKRQGADALAVAIGTAHGAYKGTPRIRFELLHKLRDAVPVPLVLHGGSGTGEENLRRCTREGINKLNLSNDLKKAAIEKPDEPGSERQYRCISFTRCLRKDSKIRLNIILSFAAARGNETMERLKYLFF